MTLEGLTEKIKAKVPRVLANRLKAEAKRERGTPSRLIRWILGQHLKPLEAPYRVKHGADNVSLVFKAAPSTALILEAKAEALGASVADVLSAVMIREFA